jgi:hypothetical protein
LAVDPGDALATIAESQIGTRSDDWLDRARLYGYLMATDASLVEFGTREPGKAPELHWTTPGFGAPAVGHAHAHVTLQPGPYQESGPPGMLRIHNWCAAFVDWCVGELLLRHGDLTTIPFARRPRTAAAVGLLDWGRRRGCTVLGGDSPSVRRGDIAVYAFHTPRGDQNHVGIVSRFETPAGQLHSIEGNTSWSGHGNQGYTVAKRLRERSQLKGLVRLPAGG